MPLEINELMKQVRRLRMVTAHRITERFSGEYHSVFKGQGIEFDEVREYAYGDDVRGIDWNVTARMGHPYIKSYREERELTLILLVDISGSLAVGTRGRTKAEVAAELACLVALSADRNHDKIGLTLFSDRIDKYLPPARGRHAVTRIIREMLAAESSGRGTDIGQALRFLNRVRKRRAVVFLISDFLADPYETELRFCARRHDLICCRITDPAERALPAVGLLETIDPETGTRRTIDTAARSTRRILAQWAEAHDRHLTRLERQTRIDVMELSGDQPVVNAVHDLFRRRKRRVRIGARQP